MASAWQAAGSQVLTSTSTSNASDLRFESDTYFPALPYYKMTLTQTDKSQFHPYFSFFIPESLQPKRSSRIEELLLSNKPPSEFEKQELLETLARGPQTLDEFDEKISATRHLLDFLVSERDQAASNISDAKSLYKLYADEAFNGELVVLWPAVDIESVQPSQPPWTVSCVCQQWRTVAIHTADLWSFIELNLDQRHKNKDSEMAKNRVFRLGLSLFRAHGHDLSIRVYGKNSVADVSPILQMLFPTAPYWRRLSVLLPFSSFLHFSVCKGYLNRLDTLYIGSGRPEIDSLNIDAFQLAPSLKVLGTFIYDSAFTRFSVPSSGITSFISGGPNAFGEPIEPILLHNVTFLHMLHTPCSNGMSSADMYSRLSLPSLRLLKISFYGSKQTSFPVVINPESCPIEVLVIALYYPSPEACIQIGDELRKFLRGTSKLERLYILTQKAELPDQWFNGLVYTSGQDSVAPRLRLLSMPRGRISAGDLRCLVNVVESRRRTDVDPSDSGQCALLEQVVLGPETLEFDDEELSARWMTMRAGGLIVTQREK
ncbi:uncharacterized protein EV420DRAFT_1727540 [Desarmillaria tabescens]|uniref:F-box domain-containing protein n=1 Tax=Armillaria tabescens TaxID=1929756 RepID=A0AA39JHY4_ARMTA|nr:uncharacterized protein EV420DRAFT_1727540 [Desarmillaria tabescens]KAK0442290.1 hypothetical protein EV420DRAFT_1727540 [Desarmillaria tabescens]